MQLPNPGGNGGGSGDSGGNPNTDVDDALKTDPDKNGCYDTNGNGVVDVPCPTHPIVGIGRSDLCPIDWTLTECYYARGLLNMGSNTMIIDQAQFADMLIAIHYDINNRSYLNLQAFKMSMDTPFWDHGEYAGNACLSGTNYCGHRTEINYVEQGMISARLGQSLEEGFDTVDSWKLIRYRIPEAITSSSWTPLFDAPYASNETYQWFMIGYYVEMLFSGRK